MVSNSCDQLSRGRETECWVKVVNSACVWDEGRDMCASYVVAHGADLDSAAH